MELLLCHAIIMNVTFQETDKLKLKKKKKILPHFFTSFLINCMFC